jgi:P pilus assembly chaperone PapD
MREMMSAALLVGLAWSTAMVAQTVPAAPSPAGGTAIGDLLVAPTRFVFEGNQRSAEVTLVNIGQETATYRISFVYLEMTEEGGVREVEAPADAMLAEPLIRYSPRQVTLEPQVAQTVRMQLRKPANLEPGEYRSHLLFRAIPPADLAVPAEEAEPDGLQVRLIPVYGVSIPVIVRHETTPSKVTIDSVTLEPGRSEAQPFDAACVLARSGPESVYGDLRVVQIVNGREHVVGALSGVAVYTPLQRRRILVPITPMPDMPVDSGRLVVRYQTVDPEPRMMAEAVVADGS